MASANPNAPDYDPNLLGAGPSAPGVAGMGNLGTQPTLPQQKANSNPQDFRQGGVFGPSLNYTDSSGNAFTYDPQTRAVRYAETGSSQIPQNTQPGQGNNLPDLATTRNQISDLFQSQIAAIRNQYASLTSSQTNAQEKVNQENLGRTRSALAASGQLGTTAGGEGAIQTTEQAGADAIKNIQDTLAAEEQKAEASVFGAEGAILSGDEQTQLKAQIDAQQKKVDNIVASIQQQAASGASFASLDQSTIDQMMKSTGYSFTDLMGLWQGAQVAASKPNYAIGGNSAAGYFLVNTNPAPGQSPQTIPLTKPLGQNQTTQEKNYNLAVAQGYAGSFDDWIASQKSSETTTGVKKVYDENGQLIGQYSTTDKKFTPAGEESAASAAAPVPSPKNPASPTGTLFGKNNANNSSTPPATTAEQWYANFSKNSTPFPPDPSFGNKPIAEIGGRTANDIYQEGLEVALGGKTVQSFVGGLSSSTKTKIGRENQAYKTALTNMAGALGAIGGGLPKMQAIYKADAATAAKLIGQATFIQTYTATATDNLNLALKQSPQVSRTDAPYINSVFQKYQNNFAAAPDLTKFEVYIYTAAREYAKVTSGGAMSAAGLTDSATAEAAKLLSAAQSPDQFAAAAQAMKDDMANVNSEFTKTIDQTAASLSGPSSQPPTNPQEGDTYTYQGTNYKVMNGQWVAQ